MALNLGGTIRLTYNVKSTTGVLTNPSTAVLTITQPDGTTTSPTVTLPPAVAGVLVVDFVPLQAGHHSAHWQTTLPGTSDDDMFVAEPGATLLVSVDEAVAHLRSANITTSDSDREQLQWFCMVATAAVERDLGRAAVRRVVTETHNGGYDRLILRTGPIIGITTVTESGATLTPVTDFVPDLLTGELYRGSSTALAHWASGRQNIVITYQAGYANPPREVREAALGLVQELWQVSQQAPHPLLEEQAELLVQATMPILPGPLRGAYRRLRVSGSGVA